MDHRLREIEQWVAEARKDLGESGQDAYLEKLYLLDAEIRAVIRENGILPSASSSPGRAVNQVRRQSTRATLLSGAALVAVLAAATVFGLLLATPGGSALLARVQATDSTQPDIFTYGAPLGSRSLLASRLPRRTTGFEDYAWGNLEEELPAAEPRFPESLVTAETDPPIDQPAAAPVLLAAFNEPQLSRMPAPESAGARNRTEQASGDNSGVGVLLASQSTGDSARPVEVIPAAGLPGATDGTQDEEAAEGKLKLDTAALREAMDKRFDS